MKAKKWIIAVIAAVIVAWCADATQAQQRLVNGGQTNVLLDTGALAGAGLVLSGVSASVIVPGDLGPNSVAFGVNARNGNLPTTFRYEVGSLAPFSGTIEHTGSVFFNNGTLEVGNFTVGFDANRIGGSRSGFFVASTVGLAATLFDIENPSFLDAGVNSLTIDANLLVSQELANVLGNAGLTGADVGDARVAAFSVPEPATAGLLVLGTVLAAANRRRRHA